MILNIGCGHMNREAGEIGIDTNPECKPDVVATAEDIPFPDDHFDSIRAVHVLEHVKDIVATMNECYRVLKKGGRFHIKVPLFPTMSAVSDPTHCRFFIPETFRYFTEKGALTGLKNVWVKERFQLMHMMRGSEPIGQEIYVILRKQ